MEDILDHSDPAIQLTFKDTIIHIWRSPRMVFRFVNNSAYNKHVNLLVALAGISSAFGEAASRGLGDTHSLAEILAIVIPGGAIAGFLGMYFMTILISVTGRWLNGKANSTSIRSMYAYAMIPTVAAIGLTIVEIAFFGSAFFQSDFYIDDLMSASAVVFYFSMFAEFILSIWTIVLLVIGISEVQKLSIGMSILNLLLSLLIIFVPLFLLVYISTIT